MTWVQVLPGEVKVGQTVAYSLYDREHALLLAAGSVIESAQQLEQLLARGACRRRDGALARTEPTPEPEPAAQVCQFDEIHVPIGETLQLQSHIEGNTGRYGVKLIGYAKGRSVIVSTPMQNGYVMLLREGQAFVARFFSGKSAYAFPTTILKVLNTPYPHLHLSYPKEVSGLLVRRGMRARVKLIASVTRADETSGATLHDLSVGGAMLSARRRLGKVDERITVKFRVDVTGIEHYLSLPALIRNVRELTSAEDGKVMLQHGVQFVDAPAPDQLALSAFVFQTLLDEAVDL
jgi:c-di-GMP-binding flagellar brake protein YcgR